MNQQLDVLRTLIDLALGPRNEAQITKVVHQFCIAGTKHPCAGEKGQRDYVLIIGATQSQSADRT